jgi:hypothetical protein
MLSGEKIAVVVVAIAGVALLGYSLMGLMALPAGSDFQPSQEKFESFAQAELSDKCQTPPGYDDATWKEHMSHHPDRYEGCL